MNDFEKMGRRMPYKTPDAGFTALRERIRCATTARAAEPSVRWRRCFAGRRMIFVGMAGAAAVLLAAGVFLAADGRRPAEAGPDVETLLATASAETIFEAAAMNYDDILYNQQL